MRRESSAGGAKDTHNGAGTSAWNFSPGCTWGGATVVNFGLVFFQSTLMRSPALNGCAGALTSTTLHVVGSCCQSCTHDR